jgi:hypothetical protein
MVLAAAAPPRLGSTEVKSAWPSTPSAGLPLVKAAAVFHHRTRLLL